jgi:hypothetical protein
LSQVSNGLGIVVSPDQPVAFSIFSSSGWQTTILVVLVSARAGSKPRDSGQETPTELDQAARSIIERFKDRPFSKSGGDPANDQTKRACTTSSCSELSS